MENMDNLVMKPMEQPAKPVIPPSKNKGGLFIIIIFFGVLLGVLSGFGLSKLKGAGTVTGEKIQSKTEVGIKDEKTFKDSAEGKVVAGGVDGEGTHHLVRPGGDSQNVYLTSSVVDLNQFVGKTVKVFGQTFATQTAGWFMDVGRVELK